MIASAKPKRYFVRRATRRDGSGFGMQYLNVWSVCDSKKFNMIEVATFVNEAEADAVCKLLNSNEEYEND